MKQKIVALALSLVCMGQTTLATTLQDITSHWGKTYIEACVASGYMKGDDEGNFNPDNQMTYGEFSVVIVNGYYGGKTNPKSTDTHWADPYLNVLIDDGLFVAAHGFNYATNSSDSSVTKQYLTGDITISRTAVATVIANLMNRGSGFVTGSESLLLQYSDLKNIYNNFGIKNVQNGLDVIANGIMTGSDGEFNLNGKLTRAEAAVIFVGMKDKGVFDGKATGSSSSSNTTTGTTSTPSTSTGTVTTPSVSTPSTTPSTSTSTSKPSDVVLGSGQYNVYQYTVPADVNKDGWITYSEVEAVFAQLQEEYPQGTPWTNDNKYTSNLSVTCWTTTRSFAGCAAFAWLVSDRIFGDLPIRRITPDANVEAREQIRPGDVHGSTAHWLGIVGDWWGTTEYYHAFSGNSNGMVGWDGASSYERLLGSICASGENVYVYTRYPA